MDQSPVKVRISVHDHYYIYAILLLVLHYWFYIVGFEIDEFIISEILLFDFEHEYVMSIYMYQRLMAWLYGYDISELIIMQDRIDWWNQHIMIKWKERDIWYGLALSCGTADQELMPGTARQELMPGTAPTGLQVDQPARSSYLGQPARSLCLGQPLTGFGTWDSRPGAHPGTVLKDFLNGFDPDDDWGIDLDSPEPEGNC